MILELLEKTLQGSGGYIAANITEEQEKKADLGVGKLFLAPIGKLEEQNIIKYYCKKCETEFNNPPKIHVEENERMEVADNLVLVERGQYNCQKCNSTIGEYRVFEKKDEKGEIGNAKPDSLS